LQIVEIIPWSMTRQALSQEPVEELGWDGHAFCQRVQGLGDTFTNDRLRLEIQNAQDIALYGLVAIGTPNLRHKAVGTVSEEPSEDRLGVAFSRLTAVLWQLFGEENLKLSVRTSAFSECCGEKRFCEEEVLQNSLLAILAEPRPHPLGSSFGFGLGAVGRRWSGRL